ncbi:hypothetical protein EST38_g3293 [Candolleomyces aberdarensis]|uniref:Ketoreductase domain-containing protein n=1 Tax=Candolleomyces aberdarensis TaxID=2316362 RepID=A0A4Q2DR58_9AGAR|nr:hypothetical protein EST38_g3293 [Candolleomyces aberdarensis]
MSSVVLVTGCTTGGIGYSLCEEFARQGCKVYATSRRVETIAESSFPNIERLALDVTDDESVNKAIEHIIEKEGKLDIVVNNAGAIAGGALLDQTMDNVQKSLDLNVVSILRVSKAAMPHMANRRSGLIINIGSIVGEIPTPWNGLYCASKAAVHSMSQVLAMECQPYNVKVLHVAPGAIKSNIANNGTTQFSLPENSLWKDYLPDMIRRIHASQTSGSLPNEAFAQAVVGKALKRSNSFYNYLTLGGQAFVFSVLKWLPRLTVLRLMWKTYSKKA